MTNWNCKQVLAWHTKIFKTREGENEWKKYSIKKFNRYKNKLPNNRNKLIGLLFSMIILRGFILQLISITILFFLLKILMLNSSKKKIKFSQLNYTFKQAFSLKKNQFSIYWLKNKYFFNWACCISDFIWKWLNCTQFQIKQF